MVSSRPDNTAAGAPIIAFAGGGSGGHLYPALSVAAALRERVPDVRFVFFGSSRAIDEQILQEAGCELVQQSLRPVRKMPWNWAGTLLDLSASSRRCRERFADDVPLAVIGTGGLASVAPVHAARKAGIPTVILNPDAIPGKANRLLSSGASCVCVQWDETTTQLPKQATVRVTGCGVRPAFLRASRAEGLACFDLDPTRRTLLVTGASQGAKTINDAVLSNLPLLEEVGGWQVLHLTGRADQKRIAGAYEGSNVPATALAYTERMPEALAAADLVIARAGASTLAEITAVGRPAILMPYPFHRDQHQLANARCLVRRNAARIVHDAIDPVINARALAQVLRPLLASDDARKEMADAARGMGHGNAAGLIAECVLSVAGLRREETKASPAPVNCVEQPR